MTRNPQETRQKLIDTAFSEIHRNGFQGMRVDEILHLSGLKKGAFYHHFSSKSELAYAVIDESIRPMLEKLWLLPLKDIKDPVTDLPKIFRDVIVNSPVEMLRQGCPINNLAQEMSELDEGFRQLVSQLFTDWFKEIEKQLELGKTKGLIRQDVTSSEVARFIVASVEGSIGVFKAERSAEQWQACLSQLGDYLKTLRPKTTYHQGSESDRSPRNN